MFDGRIYRAAFLPLLFVVVIAGFSLKGRPAPLTSTLAPDAFSGARAFANLQALLAGYPHRRPGSVGDEWLARYVMRAIRGAGSTRGGFALSLRRSRAQTIDGKRTLTNIIATRPGFTGESPVVILAHRDAARPGSAAELSGTAALLELARVFAHSQTRRTIVLVSTSGGSGGDGGAAQFASGVQRPVDAAVVLGDLAGTRVRGPFVVPFSAGAGTAPAQLVQTLDASISQEVGVSPGEPGVGVQLAHLAFPLRIAEQAPLEQGGIPAVLVQVSSERGPSAGEPVSRARLQSFGRAVLSTIYALDEGPNLKPALETNLGLGRKLLPRWAMRLLTLALLLPPLLACIDGLARLRRRHQRLARSIAWVLSCACPLLGGALFAMLIGWLGIVAAPPGLPPGQALSSVGSVRAALLASALVLGLGLFAWPALARRLALPLKPAKDATGVALMLVLLGVCLLVWVLNPYASLLLIPAAHACLLALVSPLRQRPSALAAVVVSLIPLGLLLATYASELGVGVLGLGESVVLALAGGQFGVLAVVLWSSALGCVFALVLLGADEAGHGDASNGYEPLQITTRGPLSYAGPGSLGGTESALRR